MHKLPPLLVLLLLLCFCATPNASAAAANGTLEVKITIGEGASVKTCQIYAFPADNLLDRGALNYALLKASGGQVPGVLVLPKDHLAKIEGTVEAPQISLPPGVYDLAMTCGNNSAVWISKVKVQSGQTADLPIALEKPGSVTGTWKVDVSLFKPDNTKRPIDMAGVMRDGHVWASACCPDQNSFSIPNVPPGEYTLVIFNNIEHILFTKDKVSVKSGEATQVDAEGVRADQASLTVSFSDPQGKTINPNSTNTMKVFNTSLDLLFSVGPSVPGTQKNMGAAWKNTPVKPGDPVPEVPRLFIFPTLPKESQNKLYLNDPRFKPLEGQPVQPGKATVDLTVEKDGEARMVWPHPSIVHLIEAPPAKKPAASVAPPPPPTVVAPPPAAPLPRMDPTAGRKTGGGY